MIFYRTHFSIKIYQIVRVLWVSLSNLGQVNNDSSAELLEQFAEAKA